MCLELLTNYHVKISMPITGDIKHCNELAHSKWHAIDKAYTKYSHLQPDRKKYKAKAPSLQLRRS